LFVVHPKILEKNPLKCSFFKIQGELFVVLKGTLTAEKRRLRNPEDLKVEYSLKMIGTQNSDTEHLQKI